MADASLGTAVLRTKLDTAGLKTGLAQAEQETKRFAGDATTAIKGIGAGFASIAASQGLRAYIGFMRDAAAEAHQASASSALFQKALERNNQSASEGAAMVQRLADKFGVVNSVVEESATFMLRQGASLDDVERALTAAGASAAAAGFDISTAFNNVGVAVATGRSQLLETSGIVANLGPVEQAYAKSVGKTVEQLTQQERIQARVNAIYQETASEIEDVDVLLQGLPRSQAEVTRQFRSFRETAGDLALKVIVPLNNGLAVGLKWFNALPGPVKQTAIAVAGGATAATALATGIVAIKTAFTGLSGLGLLSFGPTGWVVLGVAAVAGLAVALSSASQNSLTSAVDKTRKAIASGDATSMTGALDELIKKIDGPVRETLQGMRDELVKTGDVGVEQAKRMLTEIAIAQLDARRSVLGLTLFGPSKLSDALLTGGALLGKLDLKDQVRAALDSNDLITAIDLLQDAIVAMTEAGLGAARSQPLVDFLAEIGRIPNFQFTPTPPPPPTTTPPPPTTTTGGGKAAERTIETILKELDAAGTVAMRRAAFEGTTAATVDAARERVNLINKTIDELLTDPHYGLLPDGLLDDLRRRRDNAQAIVDAGGLGDLFAQWSDYLADEVGREANRMAGGRRHPKAPDDPFGPVFEQWQDYLADEIDRQVVYLQGGFAIDLVRARRAEAERAEQERLTALTDTSAELARFTSNAYNMRDSLKAANAELERADVFAAALTKYGTGRLGLEGTSAAGRGGIAVTLPQSNAAAAEIARDTLVGIVAAYKAGGASLDDVQRAVDALTRLTPLTVKEINELTDGVLLLERAAKDAARAAEQNERAPMWVPEGGLPRVNPGFDYRPHRPRETGESDKAFIEASKQAGGTITDAGVTFGDLVLAAGHSFGGLITNIMEGNEKGAIKAGFDLFGDLGAAIFPQFAPFIKLGSGFFGDLFSALAGGGSREAESRRRQELDRARSVPAVTISFTVNQQNTYQGAPSDPQNEQAFRRQANILWEELYRRHLGPRFDRIEQRLGIAGAGA